MLLLCFFCDLRIFFFFSQHFVANRKILRATSRILPNFFCLNSRAPQRWKNCLSKSAPTFVIYYSSVFRHRWPNTRLLKIWVRQKNLKKLFCKCFTNLRPDCYSATFPVDFRRVFWSHFLCSCCFLVFFFCHCCCYYFGILWNFIASGINCVWF